ncbi:MAG: hypothetical protein HYX66_00085 [Ignavibacteria bacterium]|nr:hypothetical protein [Ignavibacteria bacterium]
MNRIIAFVIARIATYATLSAQISLGGGGTVQNTSLSGDDPTDGFFRSGIGFGAYLTGLYDVTPNISLFIHPGFDQCKHIYHTLMHSLRKVICKTPLLNQQLHI